MTTQGRRGWDRFSALSPAAAIAAISLLAAACGASRVPYAEGPIDFAFASSNGEMRRLSQLRGRPLVLALVRTSEITSEMFIDELAKAAPEISGETRLLVLSLDPNEAPMLGPYLEERGLPFPIGLADWSVAVGQSALGLVPIVPTTYLIDEDGEVKGMVPGAVDKTLLLRAVELRGWK